MVGGLASNIPEASAHENRLYNIGNKDYWITVGSINEPVFVDDKSGAEVFIKAADTSSPLNRMQMELRWWKVWDNWYYGTNSSLVAYSKYGRVIYFFERPHNNPI